MDCADLSLRNADCLLSMAKRRRDERRLLANKQMNCWLVEQELEFLLNNAILVIRSNSS